MSETVPCELCGKPTHMTGTKRCDPCWELERRIEASPEIAEKILRRRRERLNEPTEQDIQDALRFGNTI